MSQANDPSGDDFPVESPWSGDIPEEFRHLSERERVQGLGLQKMFAEQDHELRQSYADWIIRVLGVQLLVADLVFIVFAWVGRDWDLTSGVIEIWLAATVVQVIAIVAIVTRHLFPNRDQGEAHV